MTQVVADHDVASGSSSSGALGPPRDYQRILEDFKEKKNARQWILPAMFGGYIVLLFLNVSLPFVFVPLTADGAAAQVKDLMLAGSTVLQGLVSLLAIAVGYYFRESQEHG